MLYLKKQSKLTKTYQNNPPPFNQSALFNQSMDCITSISGAKERYIAKMSGKLDNLETASKTY